MNRPTTAAHETANVHPNYRHFALSETRQLRMYARSPQGKRHSSPSEIKGLIKDAQRRMAQKRLALKLAQRKLEAA